MSDPRQLAIHEHRRWLGYLQPDGLVFSAVALVVLPQARAAGDMAAFLLCCPDCCCCHDCRCCC